MDISNAIRFLRKKKGWTQQQLADFSHTSKSNISNLENGNQGYSPALLQYLAQAFGCPISQIFLLAEELEKQAQPDWENAPIDVLFMQLPEAMRTLFRKLFIEIIAQQEK
ncbi:MAG: helix-turn-helix transcriptional regulator [Eikenella sp.]|nr:helix-turn-helix transcriptional regulator [Eikenella sp.]